jgi:uncharacterized protein YfaS (alpha-2-macroglobulin family)
MKKTVVWLMGVAALFVGVMAGAAYEVTFTLDKATYNVGEAIKVTFSIPLPKEGERWWITLAPAGSGDEEWGKWQYVDAGVKELSLPGAAGAGAYEVRLHDQYSKMSYHVVCRKAVTVKGGSASDPVSFTLAKSVISPGQKPKVTFNMPLPKEGEKYWITVIDKNAADSEWGQWRYVDAGVSELELDAVPEAGEYEVRLHDRYSELSYHVIARQPLTVK